MTAWASSLRVAWRELRRSKGRSALILAMIALPVVALSFAAASYDMFRLTPAEEFARRYGSADAMLTWRYSSAVQQDWRGVEVLAEDAETRESPAGAHDIVGALPAGGRAIPYQERNVVLRTAAGVGYVQGYAIDAADPIARGLVEVVDGVAPTAAGEIAVTARAGRRLGVRIGDTVSAPVGSADQGEDSWRVTAVVEFPDDLGEAVLFSAGHLPAAEDGYQEPAMWLVSTPGPVTWDDVLRLNEQGIVVAARSVYLDPPAASATPYPYDTESGLLTSSVVDTGVLIAGLGMLEIVLLAGPAFAVGARRRRHELALVAVNGGTPRHLRRIVLADGVVLGGAGALLGTVLGVVAALAARPLVEEYLADARAGGYRVFPLALLGIAGLAVTTGVLAALVPAFAAARFNLSAAVAGRRAVVRSRKRWLALGLGLAGLGATVAGYGAVNARQQTVLIGLVLSEAGLVLCTPALVGLVARIGRLLPLSPRIALRDTARNRSSAAPAISAVMAAVAGSMVVGIYLNSNQLQRANAYESALPTGYVLVDYFGEQPPRPKAGAGNPVLDAVHATLPVRKVYEQDWYGCAGATGPGDYCRLVPQLPAEQRCFMLDLPRPYTAEQQRAALSDHRCDEFSGQKIYAVGGLGGVVNDETFLAEVVGVSPRDAAEAGRVLAAGGVVVSNPGYVRDGMVEFSVRDTRKPGNGQEVPDEKLPVLRVPGYALTSGLGGSDQIFYSRGAIAKAGFVVRPSGLVVATRTVPTQAEEDRLRAELLGFSRLVSQNLVVERGPDKKPDPRVLVLAIAAGFIALGAAGVATGLAAADGRADLATLAAVGASPRVRRMLSLSQAAVISGLGSILGVGAGVGAAFAVLAAYNAATAGSWPVHRPFPLVVPWQPLLIAGAVPLVAMLGAGLLTRSRLPIERPSE